MNAVTPEPPRERVKAAPQPVASTVTLSLARYRFTANFDRDLALPEFSGALLRSVFGLALRQGACMTGASRCEGCAMTRRCAYPAIFETPPQATQLRQQANQVPNPHVIEPPAMGTCTVPTGQAVQWHQVLVGPSTLHLLPVLVNAWERSLRLGWGRQRVRGHLVDVALVHADGEVQSIRDPHGGRLLPHAPLLTLPSDPMFDPTQVQLHFDTPCRLQQDGRPLRPTELTPRKLVADLLRRCSLMLDLHLGVKPTPFDARALVAHAQSLRDDRSALLWRDDARYSASQGQETPLGGVVGCWRLQGDLAPLLPWLWLGQWLHLGKGATMGLGTYRLQIVE